MSKIEIHSKIHYVLALLIALTLPFAKFTPLFIGLLFINWLVEGALLAKTQVLLKNKFALIFILLYVVHLVGLLYTSNLDSGFFDIEVKLSLLIFPLIIVSKPFSKKQTSYIFIAFIIGLIYASFYMLSRAFSIYFITGENAFFYQDLASHIHTSYISMYLNVAIVWLIINVIKEKSGGKSISNVASSVIIIFFTILIVLLSAKSGLLTLGLIVVGLIVYFLFYKKKYLFGLIGILLIIIGFFSIKTMAPKVMFRVDNFIGAITSKNDSETIETTSLRMLIWESSNQIIKNNFLIGVGTGDAKDALNKEYENNYIDNALKHNFNAHNEFYQVFIALGLIGIVLLCVSLFYPLIGAYKFKDYLYAAFLLIIILNFCSESMLETKAGVMFYAFFNSLLCFKKTENNI